MATARARKATSPPTWPTPRRRPTKRWWKWWPRATTPSWKSSSRRARCRSSTSSTACSRASARCASSRCCAPPALHNIGTDLILEFHRREPARSHRARARWPPSSTAQEATARSPTPSRPRPSSSRPRPIRSPAASPTSRWYTGVVKNDANLQNVTQQRRRAAGAHRQPAGQDPPAGHRAARRRYRRGRQAEGHADRRHAGRQGRRTSPIPPVQAARALHRLRHRGQVAQRRRPHGQRRPPHSGRGPVAALLSRPADPRIPAGRQRPAARRNRRQPPEEALRRGCHAEGAQDSVSRDHSRQGRRAGPPQEADRRPRPVRRLLDQDGAAAARRQVRVRQRDLRRLDSQELHPGRGKGHRRGRRERLSGRLSRWWISR